MYNSKNEGPIPGENYTSDTKNYPWHQPPQLTDLNKALDMISVKMTSKKTANSLMDMVELGVPLIKISSMMIMSGVGSGKWTPDLALLLAGPVTKILEIICVTYGVEYTLGLDDEEDGPTGDFFKSLEEIKSGKNINAAEAVSSQLDTIKEDAASTPADTPAGGPTQDLQTQGFAQMNSKPSGKEAPVEGKVE